MVVVLGGSLRGGSYLGGSFPGVVVRLNIVLDVSLPDGR